MNTFNHLFLKDLQITRNAIDNQILFLKNLLAYKNQLSSQKHKFVVARDKCLYIFDVL